MAEQKARTIESDLQFILTLGQIFDVNDRAAALVAQIRQAFNEVRAKTADLPRTRVTVTDPSVADPSSGGQFYTYGGTVLDNVLATAGGMNVWSDQGDFGSVSKESALVRPADVVVFGEYDGAPAPDVPWIGEPGGQPLCCRVRQYGRQNRVESHSVELGNTTARKICVCTGAR